MELGPHAAPHAALPLFALATCASPNRVNSAALSQTPQRYIDNHPLVGVPALITQNGNEAYFGAFGYADRAAHRPMARDTVVQIYSVTKPITGVALMQLWEQGKFVPELANCFARMAMGTPNPASMHLIRWRCRIPMANVWRLNREKTCPLTP